MLYADYLFQIDEKGLLMYNTGEHSPLDMVQIEKTPLNVGDKFTLELDEQGRMFFRRTSTWCEERGIYSEDDTQMNLPFDEFNWQPS